MKKQVSNSVFLTRTLPAFLLVVLTVLAYIPAISCTYIWDDDFYVKNNRCLRSLDGLGKIWLEPRATPQYYPLVHSSFWLEYHLWGLHPAGYHIINILLHAFSAVILWRILTFLRIPGAWLAAAVFALHPVHVESVAWITERKNVLSGLFYLAAMLFGLKWALTRDSNIPDNRNHLNRWYVFSLLLFVAALLSKTVTATLPAAVILILWWQLKRIQLRTLLPWIPFFILGAGMGLLTAWLEKSHVGAEGEEWSLTFIERILVAGRAVGFYIAKIFCPHPLMFFYPRWDINAAQIWQFLFPAGVALAVILLWLTRRRIGAGPFVALAFSLITLFPAMGFFNVYPMRYSYVADHFQYLASLGAIVFTSAFTTWLCSTFRPAWRLWGITLAGLTLTALLLLTARQCRIYQNEETLWQDTIEKNPAPWMAYNNLGIYYQAQKKFDLAVACFQKTIEIKPDHVQSRNNWGCILRDQKNYPQAESLFLDALRIKPDFEPVYNNLGILYAMQENYPRATEYFLKALDLKPNFEHSLYNLANVYRAENKFDQARSLFEKTLKLNPNYIPAWFYLGQTFLEMNDLPAAQQCLDSLQKLDAGLADQLRKKIDVKKNQKNNLK